MNRPTCQQHETLVDFLMQNPGIAKGILRTAHAKRQTKRKWNEISISLNALGGVRKDGKGWAKYWADKKCALKKLCAQQHAQSMKPKGGEDADNLQVISPLDQQLIAVIWGPQFAVGDSPIAVDSFPSTSQNQVVEDARLHAFHQQTPESESVESPASPEQKVETMRETRVSQSPVILSRSQRTRTQYTQTKTVPDQDRERLSITERQRVEAETATARALSEAVEHMAAFRTSMEDLSSAIRDSALIMSNALNNIADALQHTK